MRLNALDLGTMAKLLTDLAAAHGKTFGSQAERQVAVYHEALRDCSVEEVTTAVKTACRDFDRFPKPKHLRALIMAHRPPRRFAEQDFDRCPQCQTAYQWRRLPHWVKGPPPAESLECDCGWRMMVRGYATEDDLDQMGPDDPFAADEMRRRAAIQRAAA